MSAIFVWRALRNFATDMANVENVEDMVGTREAEAAAVVTESGGAVATDSGGAMAAESGGAATTGDEMVATAGDETAATGGVMYVDESPYTINVRHVEEMVGTTREAADGDRVRRGRDGDETGDETGGPRDETGDNRQRWLVTNETAATGGVMYADEGPYTIDVRYVEEMVGTTRKAADGNRVRRRRDGDETGDETGGPRNETGDKTAVTAGDERVGGDWWGNVYGRRGVRI